MKYFFLFFITTTLFAQNSPQCPTESFLIEFTSPVTGGKKSFCGYQKDGATVKHGEEWSFDRSGAVAKKTSFVHGMESSGSVDVPKGLPGVDEAVAGSEVKILSTITELLQILTLKKNTTGKGMFKVHTCDARPADWLKGAIFGTPIQKSYAFGEGCDVAGSFSANFKQEFPMQFELRNLQDFTKTNLKLRMAIVKLPQGVRYRFEVFEGSITAPTRNANFTVKYSVEIDPMTGVANKNSQFGSIILTKIDGKEVKAEALLRYED